MSCSYGIAVIACIYMYLLNITDVSGVITNPPLNIVAEVGQQAIFNCTSSIAQQNWILTTKREDVGTTAVENIALSCVVQPGFATHYEVDRPGGNNNICNLIVKVATMQQAGVYTCTDSATGPSAILTVLDSSSPKITYNNTPDVIEGENVIITCSLNYNGSVEPAPTLRPHFYWTDNTGNNASNVYNSPLTNNSVVSQLTVTAGRKDIMPYTCHVYLQLKPPVTSGYATNTPSVGSSASSPIITVLYTPSLPVTTSRPEVITINGVQCGINVLTCSNSTGNPAPKYRWYDTADNVNILSTSNELTLAEVGRNYKCEAYNTIRNVEHNALATYTGDVVFPNGTNETTVEQCYMHSFDLIRTIILACVFGLLNIIATIAFIVYYMYKRKSNNKERQAFTFKNKMILNARFLWLQRMLPCMNESTGNARCTFLWILLFILMSICAGIIVFPILVAMANCSEERNDAKDDTDIGMSSVYQNDSIDLYASVKSGTDAHGHAEALYADVETMHPGRTVVLEEPTSSDTKADDKVFYTKVNINVNAEEGVQRYTVSQPS